MITIEFLRQTRVGGYALFDLAVSFFGMYLLSPLLSKIFLKFKVYIPKLNWLYLTLPIGIIAHILIGRITLMTANFLDLQGHYVLKVVIVILCILGLRGIKIVKTGTV